MRHHRSLYLAGFNSAFACPPPRPAASSGKRPRFQHRWDPRLTRAFLATTGPSRRTALRVLAILAVSLATIFALR